MNIKGTNTQYHGTIIQTGITCNKIPCYIRNLTCRWHIAENKKTL